MKKPLKGFISYSHENKAEKNRLIKFLAVMKENNELTTWHDGDIIAGDAARQEDILKEVADSDLLLFLVSADSLASEGCKEELEEASKRGIKVISEVPQRIGLIMMLKTNGITKRQQGHTISLRKGMIFKLKH